MINRDHPVFGAPLAAVALLALILTAGPASAVQQYHFDISVAAGGAARVDMPVEASVDLTTFLGGIPGALDPATFQVVELDLASSVIDAGVFFQFDAAPDFDPAGHAVGNLVFVMNDTTPALSTRLYRVLFDVAGACLDCPAPPVVPTPVVVDSLLYENQQTFRVATPRADYYYHREGAGLASVFDVADQDWLSFHDVPGSGSGGEYRGIPNMVYNQYSSSSSFFHPGFRNATSTLVSSGPLKVTIRSATNDPFNKWVVLWEFYPTFARMTVEQTGATNGGAYWYLYEGTPGGVLDMGDVIVRPDGTTTSALDNADQWETALTDPQWLYFRDTTASRYLYLSDDSGDTLPDSHRSMGSSMTVFGFGRVLNTSDNALVGRMTGTGRTFTMGLGEDHTTAADEIAGATLPLGVTVGEPTAGYASGVGDLPRGPVLHQNSPNPFNPETVISFTLTSPGAVRLAVYDMAGRLVRILADGDLGAGTHNRTWDGQDENGRVAASGVYLYRLVSGGTTLLGKMTLVE